MRRVYFWHLKALGYCNRRMRVWCKAHDRSWRWLVNEGIDVDTLLSLDDSSMAHNAVAFAESTGWASEPVSAGEGAANGGCV